MPTLFTKTGYRDLLRTLIAEQFAFSTFDHRNRSADNKTCLLRHDIDADLGAALEMARIEQAEGVHATYFLMLRSPLYNLFGRSNTKIVQEIIRLGHAIGLHYDEGFRSMDQQPTEELISMEADILEKFFGQKITVVSFHQPGENILQGRLKLQRFLNTYDADDLKGFMYLSDSNKVWKTEPTTLIKSGTCQKLQLLIHPLWWMHENESTTQDAWNRAILANWERSQEQLVATERAYGAPRHFKISS